MAVPASDAAASRGSEGAVGWAAGGDSDGESLLCTVRQLPGVTGGYGGAREAEGAPEHPVTRPTRGRHGARRRTARLTAPAA
ncbi:hypothetical protein GCM10010349_35460 [Streptomyces flavofungini]|nr:hypothetical protein GCM10010349_35460 [Streptomyces flavofungini]